MKKIIGIYKLISPSGKCYIGQSTNIIKRWKDHKRDKKNKCPKLFQAIKKYGYENFKKEIIEECLFELLDEREIFWIKHYNSVVNGYNCDHGGQGCKIFSNEHKEKLRKAFLGVYNGSQNIEFYIDNILYKSIGNASKKLKIPAKTIHNRLNSTNPKFCNYLYKNIKLQPNRKPIKTLAKGVTINGIFYKTLRKASEILNIPVATLWRKYVK